MRRTTGLMAALILGALFALTVGPLAQSKADVALRAAIETETVKGDLKAAIEQYKVIAAGTDRAAAAKALLRMGQCYEKLGDTESRKAYERVVRDFADQKESVTEAQARLAARVTRDETGFEARKIFSVRDERVFGAAISRDGRYVAHGLPNGYLGRVVVQDLVTGEDHQVATASSMLESLLDALISPDGKRVAYTSTTAAGTQFHVVNADGSGSRVLTEIAGVASRTCDWSPDGSHILVASITLGPSQPAKLQRKIISIAEVLYRTSGRK
jgi:hypothetical protein